MFTGTINGELLLQGGKRKFSPLIEAGMTSDAQHPDQVLFRVEETWVYFTFRQMPRNGFVLPFDGFDYTRFSRQVGLRDMLNCKAAGKSIVPSLTLWFQSRIKRGCRQVCRDWKGMDLL